MLFFCWKSRNHEYSEVTYVIYHPPQWNRRQTSRQSVNHRCSGGNNRNFQRLRCCCSSCCRLSGVFFFFFCVLTQADSDTLCPLPPGTNGAGRVSGLTARQPVPQVDTPERAGRARGQAREREANDSPFTPLWASNTQSVCRISFNNQQKNTQIQQKAPKNSNTDSFKRHQKSTPTWNRSVKQNDWDTKGQTHLVTCNFSPIITCIKQILCYK